MSDDWRAEARCATVDPEVWFPESGQSARPAKAICGRCAVAVPCLQYALDNQIMFGVYGGVTPLGRKALRMRRDAA